ncbi:MAG: LysE family translocator [Thermoplasmatales archaeon]|nr:LysE family translocator [Thermoplasmatales archaeon]MCW6169954.1 LysE family translocator [Thermoplasmatales archaeon]
MNQIILALMGLLLGVSLAGPPGPVTAIMIQRAIRSAPKSFVVGLGAMTADFTLMVIILFLGTGIGILRFSRYIYIAGAFFFLYLAFVTSRSNVNADSDKGRGGNGYIIGLTIGLINPLQIGWWLTAGLSVYGKFGIIPIAFLFIGIVIWISFLSLFVNKTSIKYGKKVEFGVKIFSVASLVIFGILFIYLAFA